MIANSAAPSLKVEHARRTSVFVQGGNHWAWRRGTIPDCNVAWQPVEKRQPSCMSIVEPEPVRRVDHAQKRARPHLSPVDAKRGQALNRRHVFKHGEENDQVEGAYIQRLVCISGVCAEKMRLHTDQFAELPCNGEGLLHHIDARHFRALFSQSRGRISSPATDFEDT